LVGGAESCGENNQIEKEIDDNQNHKDTFETHK